MARVLDRQTTIEQLKRGSEIRGDPIWGYTLYYGTYDGWTVRSDTLINLIRQGVLSERQSQTSNEKIYRWKEAKQK